jgi:hypothetical protein
MDEKVSCPTAGSPLPQIYHKRHLPSYKDEGMRLDNLDGRGLVEHPAAGMAAEDAFR